MNFRSLRLSYGKHLLFLNVFPFDLHTNKSVLGTHETGK